MNHARWTWRISTWTLCVCFVGLGAAAAAAPAQPGGPPPARQRGWVVAEGGGSIGRSEAVSPVFAAMAERTPVRNGEKVIAVVGSPEDPPKDDAEAKARAERPADQLLARFSAAGFTRVLDVRVGDGQGRDAGHIAAIASAGAVFMRGGSQTEYAQWWGRAGEAGTVAHAIAGVYWSGGVVGGTSAGCAVLGEWVYDAAGGSCGPRDALRDGQTKRISFVTGLLDLVPGVLFDTHFGERGRLARLPVMLGRLQQSHAARPLGVGVDARTALLVGPDLVGEVLGPGSVTVLRLSRQSVVQLPEDAPPTVTAVEMTMLVSPMRVDLTTGRIVPGPKTADERWVKMGHADAVGHGPFHAVRSFIPLWLEGSDVDDTFHAQIHLDAVDNERAVMSGAVRVNQGRKSLPGVALSTRAFDSPANTETRVAGLLWIMARAMIDRREEPGLLGVLLTRGVAVESLAGGAGMGGQLVVQAPRASDRSGLSGAGATPASAVVVEWGSAKAVAVGGQMLAGFAPGPWASAAVDGGVLHVLAPGWVYDAGTRRAAPLTR
ncbi:MAG: cyanophycinase [bacterium]|jgi:cyanophycinase|nr:hypothetical protein [Phycisphaerales bacterium]MCE2653368.1 hypothetical protein [Planctomycetaceae bacterium]